jgi:hypothetical protein
MEGDDSIAHRLRRSCLSAAVLALVACGGGGKADATAQARAAPEPAKPLDFAGFADKVGQYNQCAIAAGQARGIGPRTYAGMLAEKGVLPELAADARSVAQGEIARFESISPPDNDAGRVGLYLHAIDAVGFAETYPQDVRAKAQALGVYYQSLLIGTDCPIDDDIQHLINKSHP